MHTIVDYLNIVCCRSALWLNKAQRNPRNPGFIPTRVQPGIASHHGISAVRKRLQCTFDCRCAWQQQLVYSLECFHAVCSASQNPATAISQGLSHDTSRWCSLHFCSEHEKLPTQIQTMVTSTSVYEHQYIVPAVHCLAQHRIIRCIFIAVSSSLQTVPLLTAENSLTDTSKYKRLLCLVL